MKDLLKEIAVFNAWSNRRISEFIISLPSEKQKAEVPSSFRSLLATLLHMWNAESAWWQRVRMVEHLMLPGDNFSGDEQELVRGLLSQSQKWEEWITGSSSSQLEHVCQYQNSKREVVKMPVYQIAYHVFNHSTYHRGQLVNMCRQLGIEKIPDTDFSSWVRSRKQVSAPIVNKPTSPG
jgi:uncharacterized damage-inducible protein DinB